MFTTSGIRALDLRAMATDGASGAQGAKIAEISPVYGVQTFRAETTAQISALRDSLERDREDMAALRAELTARFDALMARLEPAENPSLRFGCFGSLPPPSDSPVPRVRGTTPSSTDGSSLSMFMGNSASSGSKAPQSGPLPTPASYCAPPPHRLPSNQNQWVPLPQAVHVISSPSSPYPLPPQPNHTEFCQLSLGPTASPLTASNPSCSPPFSAVPEHKEVPHSGPASALVDEHEKLSPPVSVAVTDKLTLSSPNLHRDDVVVTDVSPPLFLLVAVAQEAKLTSSKCESDEADVPNGTTTGVALGSAPQLDHELVSPRATTPKMLKTTIHHLIQTQRQSMSTAAHSNRTRLVGASEPTKYDPISAGADELDVPLGPPPALGPVTKKQDFSALAKETSKGRALALDWLGDDSGGFPTMKIAINCFPPGLVLKDFELLVAADHMLKDHGKSATVSRCIQLLFDEVIFLNSSLKAPMRCPRLVESFVTVAVSMLEISKPARIPKTIDSVHQFILGHFGVSNLMATYEVANLHASLPYWRVARLHSATSSHKEYFEYDLHIDNLMASRRVNAQNLFVHMQIATPASHYSGFTLPLLNVDIVTVVPSIIHAWEFHFAHLGPPLPKSGHFSQILSNGVFLGVCRIFGKVKLVDLVAARLSQTHVILYHTLLSLSPYIADIAYIDHDIAICEHLTSSKTWKFVSWTISSLLSAYLGSGKLSETETASITYQAVGVLANLRHSSLRIKGIVLLAGALQLTDLPSSPCSECQSNSALLLVPTPNEPLLKQMFSLSASAALPLKFERHLSPCIGQFEVLDADYSKCAFSYAYSSLYPHAKSMVFSCGSREMLYTALYSIIGVVARDGDLHHISSIQKVISASRHVISNVECGILLTALLKLERCYASDIQFTSTSQFLGTVKQDGIFSSAWSNKAQMAWSECFQEFQESSDKVMSLTNSLARVFHNKLICLFKFVPNAPGVLLVGAVAILVVYKQRIYSFGLLTIISSFLYTILECSRVVVPKMVAVILKIIPLTDSGVKEVLASTPCLVEVIACYGAIGLVLAIAFEKLEDKFH